MWDVKLQRGSGLSDNQFFLVGVLIGSACGLVLGSALGFELHAASVGRLIGCALLVVGIVLIWRF